MLSEAVTVLVVPFEVPAIVSLEVPRGVLLDVRTLSVLVPLPFNTGFVLNDAVEFAGSPETLKFTDPLNPPDPVTVTV